jgi:multidrug efflux pump subunit AcrB
MLASRKFRWSSKDGYSHLAAAEQLYAALRAIPGMQQHVMPSISILQLDVRVDQARAHAAGLSSRDIAQSLGDPIGRQRGQPLPRRRYCFTGSGGTWQRQPA